MLSRKTSNASGRLRRAKSNSSVNSRRRSPTKSESIDPVEAHQHALAAASLAYERSSGRETYVMGGGSGLRRHDSKGSMQTATSHPLPRKQSIRFSGPTAKSQRQMKPRTIETNELRQSEESSRGLAPLTASERTRPQALTRAERDSLVAMAELDHHFIPEGGIASAPSSYRRLQKTKSMFDTRVPASKIYATESPKEGLTAETRNGRDSYITKENILKKTKSTSFLSARRVENPLLDRRSHEAAVQMARDVYLQQDKAQKSKEHLHTRAASSARRQHKTLRKSVRSSSHTSSYGSAISSGNQHVGIPKKSFGTKARNFSATVKGRIKRVFHRSVDQPEAIPVQQLDASRAHFGDDFPPVSDFHQQQSASANASVESLSPVRLPMAFTNSHSLTDQPITPEGSSYGGQNDSVNDRSRVTSWTDSTPGTSLAPRRRPGLRSMSVIQEDGLSQGQNVASNREYIFGERYGAFGCPMPGADRTYVRTGAVDCHRVYSALRRRLDDTIPDTNLREHSDPQGEINYQKDFEEPILRSNSAQSNRSSTTIKQFNEKDKSFSDGETDDNDPESAFLRFSIEHHADLEGNEAPQAGGNESPLQQAGVCHEEECFPASNQLGVEESPSLERAETNEMMGSDRESFSRTEGTTLPCHTARTYRLAIGATSYNSEDRHPPETPRSDWGFSVQSSEALLNPRPGSSADVSSIYSRTTSGNTPPLIDSVLAPPKKRANNIQDSLAMMKLSDRRNFNSTSSDNAFTASVGSSVEWKTMMSSQALNQGQDVPWKASHPGPNRFKAFGHRREDAQIDGDDSAIGTNVDYHPPLGEIHRIAAEPRPGHDVSIQDLFARRRDNNHQNWKMTTDVQARSTLPQLTEDSGFSCSSANENERPVRASSTRQEENSPKSKAPRKVLHPNTNDAQDASASRPTNTNSHASDVSAGPGSSASKFHPLRTTRLRDSPERARKLAAYRSKARSGIVNSLNETLNNRSDDKENQTPSPSIHYEEREEELDNNVGARVGAVDQNLESERGVEIFLSRRRRDMSGSSGTNAFI
ncbi:MAG: hypothetical protein M1837_006492 [Sclerophora amabilis]|nr:MAG: hypothetical protein M1837_006492 [Sclerophora amabilis]